MKRKEESTIEDGGEWMMGILYEKVTFTQELKKQIMIRQLLDAGIREHDGKHVSELDYYTLRWLLVTMKL